MDCASKVISKYFKCGSLIILDANSDPRNKHLELEISDKVGTQVHHIAQWPVLLQGEADNLTDRPITTHSFLKAKNYVIWTTTEDFTT